MGSLLEIFWEWQYAFENYVVINKIISLTFPGSVMLFGKRRLIDGLGCPQSTGAKVINLFVPGTVYFLRRPFLATPPHSKDKTDTFITSITRQRDGTFLRPREWCLETVYLTQALLSNLDYLVHSPKWGQRCFVVKILNVYWPWFSFLRKKHELCGLFNLFKL